MFFSSCFSVNNLTVLFCFFSVMRNIAIKSTFKECQNEHIYKYDTITIKDQILKSLCIGVKKRGDFNWCRFWAKNRLVIWCCGIICQEVFNFIQIEIDPGYNVLKTVWKWMSLYKWPLYNLFWPFFANVCPTFTKLRLWQSFWGA